MIDLVIEARRAAIAAGMEVRRILPFRARRMVGPFIFMDHAGPVAILPEEAPAMDVLPHPHIGLSTVSYLFSGQVTHRDSLGIEQTIRPGEVNWMTAGKGIAHSERFEDMAMLSGNTLEMIQTWVALPEHVEETDPEFNNYKPEVLPVYTETGVWMRVIAGSAFGLKNDVKIHSPLFYVHVVLQEGKRFTLPAGYPERAAYVARGTVEISGRDYSRGQMIVFNAQAEPVIAAKDGEAIVMLLGGDPLGERFIWWNFVSSRKERIEQAKADWKAGRIKLPPNDNREFVPLPDDRSKPSGSPSPQPLS